MILLAFFMECNLEMNVMEFDILKCNVYIKIIIRKTEVIHIEAKVKNYDMSAENDKESVQVETLAANVAEIRMERDRFEQKE